MLVKRRSWGWWRRGGGGGEEEEGWLRGGGGGGEGVVVPFQFPPDIRSVPAVQPRVAGIPRRPAIQQFPLSRF